MADSYAVAKEMYPILNNYKYKIVNTPDEDSPYYLEHFEPGEVGSPTRPRPKEINIDEYGLQIFKDVRPEDIAGDVISHHLVNEDKYLSKKYIKFKESVPSETMKRRYEYHKNNLGEERDFDSWSEKTGYPELFRGYVFNQFDEEIKNNLYSSEQKIILDDVKDYITKKRKTTSPDLRMAEGGPIMNEQMKMAFMMDEGGLRDDGMNNDPVSGNEVPSGSMAKEVRDDIPAQLSEGEYVVPADVVRYYGIKFFEDLREMAKMGLQDMENNGRIGGEPVAAGTEPELSQDEMQAIQQMMGMAEGGAINAYRKQQSLYTPSNSAVGNPNIETGNEVQGFNAGTTGATSNQVEQNILNQGTAAQAENYTGAPLGFSLFESQNQQPQSLPFTPVNMVHPETFVRAVATTPEMKKSLEDQGYIVDDGSLQPPEQTGGGSGGGGGGGPTTKPEGWKKWLEGADWSSEKGIRAFVDGIDYDPTKDSATGKSIAAGLVGGSGAGLLTAGLSAKPGLTAVSDLNAARLIAKAQGLDDLAAELETKVKNIIDTGPGILDYLDDIFATGKSKANAWAKSKGFKNIQEATEAGVTPTVTPTTPKPKKPTSSKDKSPVVTSTGPGSNAASNQSAAQTALNNLNPSASNTSNAAQQTANIIAASDTGGPSGAANQANTIAQNQQIQENLANAVQNPSGQISLNKGGLMTKGKKKK